MQLFTCQCFEGVLTVVRSAVAGQIHEMELVRGKIYQLEQTHLNMKAK